MCLCTEYVYVLTLLFILRRPSGARESRASQVRMMGQERKPKQNTVPSTEQSSTGLPYSRTPHRIVKRKSISAYNQDALLGIKRQQTKDSTSVNQ